MLSKVFVSFRIKLVKHESVSVLLCATMRFFFFKFLILIFIFIQRETKDAW